jgi:hypothetical protein
MFSAVSVEGLFRRPSWAAGPDAREPHVAATLRVAMVAPPLLFRSSGRLTDELLSVLFDLQSHISCQIA